MKKLSYGKHYIDQMDINLVKESLNSKMITDGLYVKKKKKKIKLLTKSKFSLACNSGTAAIHLSLLAIGIKKNDNVLMPTVNFVAAYNMCKVIGANPILL